MHLRSLRFAAFSLGITLLGCKDKPAPEGATVRPDVPPPAPSATAVVTATPSASAIVEAPTPPPTSAWPAGPRFAVRYRAPKNATLFWLGAGVVVCDSGSCFLDAHLITEKGVTDTYEPRKMMEAKHPQVMNGGENSSLRMAYDGVYPEVCAQLYDDGSRNVSWVLSMKRTRGTWEDGICPSAPNEYEDPAAIKRPPRDLDDALLHAPIAGAQKSMLRGANAPPMLVADQVLYVWDGKTWTKRDAPWKKPQKTVERSAPGPSDATFRLTNGMTMVTQGGYVVNEKGEILALQLLEGDKPVGPNVEVVGAIWDNKFPWIVAMDDKEIYITSPDARDKLSFVKAPIAIREPAAKKAAPAPTPTPTPANPAPSGSTNTPELIPSAWDDFNAATRPAPSSNAPSKPVELPAFTAECKTPFVLLASPPKPGQAYATTRESLKGHGEFQDLVTFVEIVMNEKTLFGVQTRTEDDARKFMELVEKNVKGMKPALKCFDVVSQIPDRYNPPDGMRIVGINLTTGELVPFD